MIKIGLTGGIGSGKSTVAQFFEGLGIAVYYADIEAKNLMMENSTLKMGILKLFGTESYLNDGSINRSYIASKVFGNTRNLRELNKLVHPLVATHFEAWCAQQTSIYVIKEAAILFENEGYKNCDYTLLITTPKELRIQRVQRRDHSTRDQILARMGTQWSDHEKMALADCVLVNIDLEKTRSEVLRVDIHLKRRIARGWKS